MKGCIVILLAFSISCCIEPSHSIKQLTIMSWNVQNLFDDKDHGDEYIEFSVQNGEWNSELYNKRLSLLSGIISSNNPDIVALQEIEGERVLKDFVNNYLKEYKYYIATDSLSAVEVGFISKIPISRVGIIEVGDPIDGLRPILEVLFTLDGKDLIIFNNHWKSKSGGGGEKLRIKSASVLKKRLWEIRDKEFIVLGDLNENFDEYLRVNKGYKTALLLDEEGDGISISASKKIKDKYLYTPWEDSNNKGSYIYRGDWEAIDHFLLCKKLLDNESIFYSSFMVDIQSTLFFTDNKLNSWKTYIGSGYSDHLPIILTLSVENKIVQELEEKD